jgi:hypothetical protein
MAPSVGPGDCFSKERRPQPFVWHRTAEEIVAKVRRGRASLDRVTKPAMHHQWVADR